MIQSVRKFTPLALTFLVSMAGTAFAGDNEGATFSITEVRLGFGTAGVASPSPESISGVGPNAVVEIDVAAANWVSVKQVNVNIGCLRRGGLPDPLGLTGSRDADVCCFSPRRLDRTGRRSAQGR